MAKSKMTTVTVVIVIVAGVLFVALGLMPPVNALAIGGFVIALYGYKTSSNRPAIHHLLWLFAFIIGVFIATYRPENFGYPLIASLPYLHAGGEPFQLYLNVSKALAGWMLVIFLLNYQRSKESAWIQRQDYALILVAAVVLFIIISAQQLLQLEWTPKLPRVTPLFILVNVAITCVAEEAFFRLLLQRHLMRQFLNTYLRIIIPVIVVGLIFAFTHHAALDALFVVYAIAGAGYALVYALTERFTMAVAVHAGVNIAHFLLLPYPLSVNS